MIAKPLKANILFAFLNNTDSSSGMFKDATASGIILSTILDTQTGGRWAKALLVGPDSIVKAGQHIFIKPLMWTIGFTFDSIKIWKTDDTKILAVSDEVPEYQVS